MLAYVESDQPFGATAAEVSQSVLEVEQELSGAMKDVTGFDASHPGEPAELLADWSDDSATDRKRGLAFFARIRPDTAEAMRRFAKEACWTTRRVSGVPKTLGIIQETVTLNHMRLEMSSVRTQREMIR